MVLIVLLMFGKLLQIALFGHLRAIELEHLYERAWYAMINSFLAMTSFRDDLNVQFCSCFVLLTFCRVFHWITSDRVDLMFQVATPPSLFQRLRMVLTLALLLVTDIACVKYGVTEVLLQGPGIMIVFAFEFVLLTSSLFKSIGKFAVNTVESRYLEQNPDEDVWESKNTWTFSIEIAVDVGRMASYIAYFVIMSRLRGITLHIFSDMYTTVIDVWRRVRDFLRTQRARAQMDEMIHDAVEGDLARDNVCIICREEMVVGVPDQPKRLVPKRLECAHVIHFGCLKSWLERSQRCPTCRAPVVPEERERERQREREQEQERQRLRERQQPPAPEPGARPAAPGGAAAGPAPTGAIAPGQNDRPREQTMLRGGAVEQIYRNAGVRHVLEDHARQNEHHHENLNHNHQDQDRNQNQNQNQNGDDANHRTHQTHGFSFGNVQPRTLNTNPFRSATTTREAPPSSSIASSSTHYTTQPSVEDEMARFEAMHGVTVPRGTTIPPGWNVLRMRRTDGASTARRLQVGRNQWTNATLAPRPEQGPSQRFVEDPAPAGGLNFPAGSSTNPWRPAPHHD